MNSICLQLSQSFLTNLCAKIDINDDDIKVLSLYLSDSEEKLFIFDDLLARIELFVKILNERRFNFKYIEVDNNNGFIFKTDNGKILRTIDLSSGDCCRKNFRYADKRA